MTDLATLRARVEALPPSPYRVKLFQTPDGTAVIELIDRRGWTVARQEAASWLEMQEART